MTQQCETEKSNMIYQIDGVIIKQFISRQLGGIWIAQLVGQWLAVQLLTLRQTVVESLVQNGHNLKITNGQKKFNDPAKKRCFLPFLFFLPVWQSVKGGAFRPVIPPWISWEQTRAIEEHGCTKPIAQLCAGHRSVPD